MYESDEEGTEPADATVKRVTDAMERLKFNVAIAALMEARGRIDKTIFARLLWPLAPTVAEELCPRVR